MKKNDTRQNILKRVGAYSTMAGSLLLIGTGANAQVIYTDINPDETYGDDGDIFELDLNNDGDVDVSLVKVFTSYSASFFQVSSLGDTIFFPGTIRKNHIFGAPEADNALLGSYGTYSFPYPAALGAGDHIDDGEDFMTASYQTIVYSQYWHVDLGGGASSNIQRYGDGEWFGGQTDKYLGIRFAVDGDDYFGWLRMDVDDDNIEFTVKDYAYQSAAGVGIDAGDEVAIQSIIPSGKINAYSFGSLVNINVIDLNADNATVDIYNSIGQSVYSNTLDQKGMQIDLNNTAEGVYTLHVNADGSVYNKQLFISK